MDNENFKFNMEAAGDPPVQEPRGVVAAGFNERFIAYVLDALPFVCGIYYTLPLMFKNGTAQYSPIASFRWTLIWIAAYLIYETALSSGGRVTAGKSLMGIRVRAADGESGISIPAAFLRTLAYFISAAPLNLGYIAALFTRDNRALHDYFGGSRVVSVKERSDVGNGLVLAVSWALMAMYVVVWYKQNFLRMTPREYEQAALAHATVSKIAILEEIHKAKYGGYTDDLRRLALLTGNMGAVKSELIKTLAPDTLAIATDGRSYIISARAKNWRKTEIEVSSPK